MFLMEKNRRQVKFCPTVLFTSTPTPLILFTLCLDPSHLLLLPCKQTGADHHICLESGVRTGPTTELHFYDRFHIISISQYHV